MCSLYIYYHLSYLSIFTDSCILLLLHHILLFWHHSSTLSIEKWKCPHSVPSYFWDFVYFLIVSSLNCSFHLVAALAGPEASNFWFWDYQIETHLRVAEDHIWEHPFWSCLRCWGCCSDRQQWCGRWGRSGTAWFV